MISVKYTYEALPTLLSIWPTVRRLSVPRPNRSNNFSNQFQAAVFHIPLAWETFGSSRCNGQHPASPRSHNLRCGVHGAVPNVEIFVIFPPGVFSRLLPTGGARLYPHAKQGDTRGPEVALLLCSPVFS